MKDITIRFSGSLTIGRGDVQLHDMVRKALDEDHTIIVLDMAGVDYMDSAAVGELAASYTSARNREAQIALSALRPKVKQLLGVMCFLDLFPVFDSTEDALQIMRDRARAGN